MNKTILQIPIDKETRDQAVVTALGMGFSSLQEPIRLFIKQLAQKELQVKFEPKSIQLSPKAIKRYNKILDQIDKGQVISTDNIDDFLAKLKS